MWGMAPAGRRVRFGAVAGAAAVLGALPVAPALAAPAGGQPAAVTYRVVDLGTLPGGSFSAAEAVNENAVATGQSDGRAVLFRAGQVIDLGVGAGSGGLDINEFGEVVGFRQSGADTVAFRWLNGKVADLAPLAGDTGSFAVAVNDSGQAVGFSSPSGRPVLWAADGTARDLSGTKLVRASGINNSGQIIGEVALAPGRNVPALVSGGRTTVLTSTLGAAADINDLGEVTGFFLDENAHGSFSWDAGLLTNIPQLPGARVSQAAAVNNHATVVGISDLAGSWVWDGGRLQALPQPDGRLVGAADINDHGQIVGVLTSTPAHPNPHAVLLQPVLTS